MALLAGLLCLGAYMAWNLLSDRDSLADLERDRLTTQVRVIDENLQRQLIAVDNALISLQTDMPDLLAEKSGVNHINHHLQSLSGAMPGVKTLFILNGRGIAIASNRAGLIGLDFSGREYFKIARASNAPGILHVSSPIRNALGTYSINLERSTSDGSGGFTGLVAATLDPEYFSTLLNSVNYSPDMWAALIHGDGTLFLTSPDQNMAAGKKLNAPGYLFARHMEGGLPASAFNGRVLSADEDRMAAFRTVYPEMVAMDQPLIVAVSRDRDLLLSPWRRHVYWQCGWFGFVAMITSATLFLYQNRKRAFVQISAQRDQEHIRLLTILKTASDGIHILDSDGVLQAANDSFLTMLRYDETIIGKLRVSDWDFQDSRDVIKARNDDLIARRGKMVFETRHRRSDGVIIDVEINASGIEIDGKAFLYAASRDITERKQAENQLRENGYILAESQRIGHIGSWHYDLKRQLSWSDETYRIYRVSPDSFTPTVEALVSLIHADDRQAMEAWITACAAGEKPGPLEFRIVTPDGSIRFLNGDGELQYDAENRPSHMVGLVQDISEYKNLELELRKSKAQFEEMSRMDPLSGLYNRRAFSEMVGTEFRRCKRFGSPASLLMIDIDHFKQINDTFGHEAGDRALVSLASTLKTMARTTDIPARYGGEEFLFLLIGANLSGAMETAERIREEVSLVTIPSDSGDVRITVSIGVASFDDDDTDWNDALRRADLAMYRAKQLGRDKVVKCDNELNFA